MKTYQCYKKYPAESADVTIWILEDSRFYPNIVVEFYDKNPLEEPFSRKLCQTLEEGLEIAEKFIKDEGFELVRRNFI